MSVQAYGSITITDLLDTATYIYYSETGSSTLSGWHTEVTAQDKYIGIYSGPPSSSGQPTQPTQTIYNAMDISKFVGDPGQSAIQYYTYIKYANSATPSSSDMSDSSSGKTYIGICITSATTAPTTYTSYTWTKFVGDPGQPGTTYYTYIRYSENSDGTNFVTNPTSSTKYLGVCVTTSSTAPTSKSSYTWSKYVGENGKGISSTVVTYQTSDSGTVTPSTWLNYIPEVSSGAYLWTRTVITYTDGTSTPTYSVARNGENGAEYSLVVNTDTIYRIYKSAGEIVLRQGIDISQSEYEFRLYDNNGNNIRDFDFSISLLKTMTINNPETQQDYILLNGYTDLIYSLTGKILNVNQILTYSAPSGQDAYYTFHLDKLMLAVATSGNEDEISALKNVLYTQNLVFSANTILNGEIILRKLFYLNTWVSDDIARFSDTSKNIKAAVDNAGYAFDNTGLTITDGNLQIILNNIADENDKRVFYVDTSEAPPKLVMRGTVYADDGVFNGTVYANGGIFNGTIHADGGSFEGTITASGGTIGGFIINEDNLLSTDQSLQLIGGSANTPSKIVVQNIDIGEGATISKYINLGNSARLFGNDDDTRLLIAGTNVEYDNPKIVINKNGTMTIGSIALDGRNSSIYGGEWGSEWNITPTVASFANIVASGKITSSIFEYNKMQVSGGSFVFRPVLEIALIEPVPNAQDQYYLHFKTDYTLSENALLRLYPANSELIPELSDSGGARVTNVTETIDPETQKKVYTYTVDAKLTADLLQTAKYAIYFGNIDGAGSYSNALLIGINSTATEGILLPKGLTLKEPIGYDADNLNFIYGNLPRAYLGDLSVIKGLNYMRTDYQYGLYSDNVILNGSLTTKSIGGTKANLYNPNNGVEQIYINNGSTAQTIMGSINTGSIVIPCDPNSKYVFTKVSSARFRVGCCAEYPDPQQNTNVTCFTMDDTATSLTITTDSTAQYLVAYIYYSTVDTGITLEDIINSITVVGTNISYAGVNTNSPIESKKIDEGINKYIVFWAGADSVEDEDIALAPFQVTQDGSIYANKGVFEGSIITKSHIEASEIYTAKVFGRHEGQEAPLNIYSTGQGINFVNSNDTMADPTDDSITLTIGVGGLSSYIHDSATDANIKNDFIVLNNGSAEFHGAIYATNDLQLGNFTFSGDIIRNVGDGSTNTNTLTMTNSYFNYQQRLIINASETQINTPDIKVYKDFTLNRARIMYYQSNNIDKKDDTSQQMFYINGSSKIATVSEKYRGFSVACKPNTTYTVEKNAGERFRVGYCYVSPVNNTPVYGLIQNETATLIDITTDDNAQYLVGYIYLENTDTGSFDDMYASLKITEYQGYDLYVQ